MNELTLHDNGSVPIIYQCNISEADLLRKLFFVIGWISELRALCETAVYCQVKLIYA